MAFGADEAPVEALQGIRAHPRIQDALHRVNVVGCRQLPALSLEHRVIGEIDAGPDADRPGLPVGRDFRRAHGGVGDELVRAGEIVVAIQRVEDHAIDAVGVFVPGSLRIEARLRRRKGDAQHLVRIALRQARRGDACEAHPGQRGDGGRCHSHRCPPGAFRAPSRCRQRDSRAPHWAHSVRSRCLSGRPGTW